MNVKSIISEKKNLVSSPNCCKWLQLRFYFNSKSVCLYTQNINGLFKSNALWSEITWHENVLANKSSLVACYKPIIYFSSICLTRKNNSFNNKPLESPCLLNPRMTHSHTILRYYFWRILRWRLIRVIEIILERQRCGTRFFLFKCSKLDYRCIVEKR